jgi:HPt (histidine-containing phosphotransfer) domain-containing protein
VESDFKNMRRISHSLKGSAYAMGACKMVDLCQYLENRSDEDLHESGEIILGEMWLEYERLTETLNVMLGTKTKR